MAIRTLQEFEELAKMLSQNTEEVKIAILLAELLKNEVINDQQFRIHPQGIFKRSYRTEIEKVSVVREKDVTLPKHLKFEIWQEGLYDSLPKGIFHDLRQEKTQRTVEQTKEHLIQQEEEQQAARDFFHPLEQAFYRLRIQVEQKERAMLAGFRDIGQVRRMIKLLWELDIEGIEHSKAISLYHFLPYVFDYKGDLHLLDQIFSLLLGTKVILKQIEGETIHIEPDLQVSLNNCCLGSTTVLGAFFHESTLDLQVSLPVLKAEEVAEYLPGKPGRKLLHILCSYLLPADAEIKFEFQLQEIEQQFSLPKSEESSVSAFNNILGFSTYLS